MRRRYLNAMALVHHFGKPDIFLTITCNLDWDEIRNQLQPWEVAFNRPDIVSQIFRLKLQDLKHQLFHEKLFVNVVAHIHVIEFQKRGLPHAHFLLVLKEHENFEASKAYDTIVLVEILDQNVAKDLHDMVLKHDTRSMWFFEVIRTLCTKGTCKCNYPHQFCEVSLKSINSHPTYRIRHDGRKFKFKQHYLDNR